MILYKLKEDGREIFTTHCMDEAMDSYGNHMPVHFQSVEVVQFDTVLKSETTIIKRRWESV